MPKLTVFHGWLMDFNILHLPFAAMKLFERIIILARLYSLHFKRREPIPMFRGDGVHKIGNRGLTASNLEEPGPSYLNHWFYDLRA
jgi:hypothetical protein